MSEPVLQATALSKTYPSGDRRLDVLRGANLAVAAGESVAITGESGCGKSTLLHLLAGLDTPDSGTVAWAGSPDTGTARRAAFLGMVFQSFYLIPELSTLENTLMAARILRAPGAAEHTRARKLIARVGLGERTHHMPAQLSGGERQRAAIARALMNSPRLLLADEPTGNLDERTGDAVVELLLSLCRESGTALVLVTHNAAHAAKASRRLTLRAGLLH